MAPVLVQSWHAVYTSGMPRQSSAEALRGCFRLLLPLIWLLVLLLVLFLILLLLMTEEPSAAMWRLW